MVNSDLVGRPAAGSAGHMEADSGKHHAHELIERLPEAQTAMAVRFLEFMLPDPVARAVAAAPPDDEALTDQDRRASTMAKTALRNAAAGHSDRRRSCRVRLQTGRFPRLFKPPGRKPAAA